MSRAVHNALLITEDSDSLDFEEEMSAFNVRFRLEKSTVDKVLSEIVDQLKNSTDRNNSIDPITQLLVTLRFYATGNFLITAGDFGGIGVASAGKIVKRVSCCVPISESNPSVI
ncbi:Uncharacterized protein FWK35_00036697 [Aphis craccivora]|uniref:Uncharacterized protein n=1 Tax=Aphis craccivora TaxID=307492 RepID=A0A6G0VQ97_APHCR|nr:Uncharacterized protein FWK35_00036697 [Aphis craccivora]